MAIHIDSTWTTTVLSLGGDNYQAFRRKGNENINVDLPFFMENLPLVEGEGGLLARHVHDPCIIGRTEYPGGLVGYDLGPAEVDIWYIPQCPFEISLELMDFFKFPSNKIAENSDAVRKLCKEMFQEMKLSIRLVVWEFSSEMLRVERMDKEKQFVKAEIDRVLKFNENYFGVRYSKSEYRHWQSFYRKNGYFFLGNMSL